MLTLLLTTMGLAQAQPSCDEANLLAGREPQAEGWTGARRASDGRVARVGARAEGSLVATAQEESASLTWTFEGPEQISALMIQSQGDDRYRVEVQGVDGAWTSLGETGPQASSSIDVVEGRFQLNALALRVSAATGGPWALAEVGAWRCGDPWPPEDLVLAEGRPQLEPVDTWRHLGGGRGLVAALGAASILLGAAGRLRAAAVSGAALAGVAVGLWAGPGAGLLAAMLAGATLAVGRKAALLLPVVALAAALSWTNFGAFRLTGTTVHYHEFFHYYFGARYAPELGYDRLYDCAVVAQAELQPENLAAIAAMPVRNLNHGELQTGAESLRRAEECRARFGETWESYRDEVGIFVYLFAAPSWQALLGDHGYNPSPVWTLTGASLASGPPAQVLEDFDGLALVDPALLLLTVGLLAWGFGWEAAAWAALIFALGWPWRYGYIGGAFARFLTLTSLAASLVALHRQRPGLAGLAVGFAGLLRVFPGLALLGPGLGLLLSRRLRPEHLRLAGGVLLALVLGFGLSGAIYGAGAWSEFFERLTAHQLNESVNRLGPQALGLSPGAATALTVAVGLLGIAGITLAARRGVASWLLQVQGLIVVLGVLNLSCYYWMLLALLGPALVGRPRAALVLVGALVTQDLLAWSDRFSPEQTHGLAWALLLPAAAYAAFGSASGRSR